MFGHVAMHIFSVWPYDWPWPSKEQHFRGIIREEPLEGHHRQDEALQANH